jgi:hypothetical protein
LYLGRFSCVHIGSPRESDCLLSITNDSSDSRSFKTDTKAPPNVRRDEDDHVGKLFPEGPDAHTPVIDASDVALEALEA